MLGLRLMLSSIPPKLTWTRRRMSEVIARVRTVYCLVDGRLCSIVSFYSEGKNECDPNQTRRDEVFN